VEVGRIRWQLGGATGRRFLHLVCVELIAWADADTPDMTV